MSLTPIQKEVGKHQFLEFTGDVKIPAVKEFTVKDFYKHGSGGITMYFEATDFEYLIVSPMREMKLSLEVETVLQKSNLKNELHDTEIQGGFISKPIIPVKTFMVQLKFMMQEGVGLNNSIKASIFHVDLTEIGNNIVVAVGVLWHHRVFCIAVCDLDFSNPWQEGCSFFAPANLLTSASLN